MIIHAHFTPKVFLVSQATPDFSCVDSLPASTSWCPWLLSMLASESAIEQLEKKIEEKKLKIIKNNYFRKKTLLAQKRCIGTKKMLLAQKICISAKKRK